MSSKSKGKQSSPLIIITLDIVSFRAAWMTARAHAVNSVLTDPVTSGLQTLLAAIAQACVHVDIAYAKLQNEEMLTGHLQAQLGLESHWEIGGDEYNCYKEEASITKY